MSTTYVVGVRIDGNAASYLRAVQQAQAGTSRFTAAAKAEFQRLKGFMQSYQGQLASLGLGVGFVAMATEAAKLQRNLTQISLTAGMSIQEQTDAYQKMFEMIKRNGGVMEETVGSFGSLIAAGLKYKEAMNATDAISDAQAVTGANPAVLAGALTVGAANFNLDLSKLGVAATMLDKMTASGRMGNAELENLSNILPRIASRAQGAGMNFDKTLAFTQAMSQIEKQPDRLATLVDSSMRLFTNMNYSKDAEKATGVKMFGKQGERRDAVAVLEDMRKKYKALKTDAERFAFMGKTFGKTDLDTQRGMSSALSGEMLEKMREFIALTGKADGTILKDMARATSNAATQAERLRNTLRHAAEGFAKPVNETIANAIKYLLDSKEKGGLELSGGQISGSAAAGAVGVYALSRILPGMAGKLLGRTGGLAAGVAEGKALQAAAGITPVYVTNWAEMGGSAGVIPVAPGAPGTGPGAASIGSAGSLVRYMSLMGKLLGPLMMLEALTQPSEADIAALRRMDAKKARDGGGSGIRGQGFNDPRIIGIGDTRAALQEALRATEVRGEIFVRVIAAPGLNVQTEFKSNSPRIPMKSLGQTNMQAGH
ncbi:MAG: phage tail tape measure protein [Rhodoferax sp.]|uniref:phage tail tape measure protein n=1 Tax=Rhodoferax sp. TaxID=50421 RepID=UPI0017F1CD8F|nr:phage tail tape measure protein [Rhodoferax sp.]NMM12465.1 phage tail tape measure protein [Rhodoferax sp.]